MGFLFSTTSAWAIWIWTPKTGKWVNPKTEVLNSPAEQLDLSVALYNEENYEDAQKELKKLLKAFPKAVEAAEAQYYLGLIEEKEGRHYEAYKEYQKVIDTYPFSERVGEIIEREFNIAEIFLGGAKRKGALGMTLPVENPAIEIYGKVVENSEYGPFAPKAQYKLGLVLKSQSKYYEAEEAFEKLIRNYPDSEWVEAAKFQIAAVKASLSKSPEYDQVETKEAKERFEDFVQTHPEASLSKEAEKNIDELREKESESNYNIGRFYEKQKEYDAARIYYETILADNPDSVWAEKAGERLQSLEGRSK